MKLFLSACLAVAAMALQAADSIPLSQGALTVVPSVKKYNINVVIPEGGEVFVAGQPQVFVYGGRTRLTSVLVEMSRDGGGTYQTLGTINNKIKDRTLRNKFFWTVTGPSSTNCIVRFSGITAKRHVAVTSGEFSIASGPDGDGDALLTGPQGDAGPAGPQGPAGPAGAQGQKGDKGDAGDIGSMGPAGPAGEQGPAGPQGPQGVKGDKGDTGDTGCAGPVGPAGPKGATGSQGPAGAAGAQGPAGPAGAQGTAGPVGPAGPKGATGATGPAGPQGPAGPSCFPNGCFCGILVLTSTNCSHDERVNDARCKPGCVIHCDFDDTDAPCDDVVNHKIRIYNGYFIVHLTCCNSFSTKHKLHYHVICP